MIPIGKRGRILNGKYAGWYVLVEDDTEGTGGYYMYTSISPDFQVGWGEGYDNWVEKKEYLSSFFERDGYQVEWEE
jgi:hypothetical protein